MVVLRGRLKRSATIWASGRTRDPYFEILGAPRGIMVTPSGGFDTPQKPAGAQPRPCRTAALPPLTSAASAPVACTPLRAPAAPFPPSVIAGPAKTRRALATNASRGHCNTRGRGLGGLGWGTGGESVPSSAGLRSPPP